MLQTVIPNILAMKAGRSTSQVLPGLQNTILLKDEERVGEGMEIKKEKPKGIYCENTEEQSFVS